jgi:hypothetical protein
MVFDSCNGGNKTRKKPQKELGVFLLGGKRANITLFYSFNNLQ